MRHLIPDPVAGALAGFAMGFLASLNLSFLGMDMAGWPATGFGVVGAAVGYLIGVLLHSRSDRARMVARRCVATAAALGGVAFLAGFAGPILLRPDLPQGPMLGIFCTGPLGTLAGGLMGAATGLLGRTAAPRLG